jgi:hypothetical protein
MACWRRAAKRADPDAVVAAALSRMLSAPCRSASKCVVLGGARASVSASPTSGLTFTMMEAGLARCRALLYVVDDEGLFPALVIEGDREWPTQPRPALPENGRGEG